MNRERSFFLIFGHFTIWFLVTLVFSTLSLFTFPTLFIELKAVAGSDKGLLRIVNSISNAVGFFYPRCEHLFFPQKKPFLVDISESLHPLDNFMSETVKCGCTDSCSIPNDSNIAVEHYILTTFVLLIINILLPKKPKWNY